MNTLAKIHRASVPVSISHSRFASDGESEEYHIAIEPTRYADFETQLGWILQAYQEYVASLYLDMDTAVLRRFFCSDPQNQATALRQQTLSDPQSHEACSISWVCQPPAFPARVALWAYHLNDPGAKLVKSKSANALSIQRGKLTHVWSSGYADPTGQGSYRQSHGVFEAYIQDLASQNLTLSDNVVRTWLFVKDVDNNYQGLVKARNEVFHREGLTPDTHYIASTGIEGGNAHPHAIVTLDAYAVAGIGPEQIEHLSAIDFLCPTQLYGVAFERATSVAYRDRAQIYISGTASIDWQGQILYPGNVDKQLDRALLNIEALLSQAGARLADMLVFIVYVRDAIDLPSLRQRMRELHPRTPSIVVNAPVCRPGWLVEIEGVALVRRQHPELPPF